MTNKKGLLPFVLVFAWCWAGSAWSYMIDDSNAGALDGTDVGMLDMLIAQDGRQGNPRREIDWANQFLDPDIDRRSGWKTEDVSYFKTDDSNVFAFELVNGPGYYIIKNAQRVALFENNESYDWGVFDVSALEGRFNLGDRRDMTISHVTQFGDTPTNVAEPGSIALLGFGLLGLVLVRRHGVA